MDESELTFMQYVEAVSFILQSHSGWSTGQTAYKFLQYVRPDISETVPEDVNPLHDDYRMPEFFAFVSERW